MRGVVIHVAGSAVDGGVKIAKRAALTPVSDWMTCLR